MSLPITKQQSVCWQAIQTSKHWLLEQRMGRLLYGVMLTLTAHSSHLHTLIPGWIFDSSMTMSVRSQVFLSRRRCASFWLAQLIAVLTCIIFGLVISFGLSSTLNSYLFSVQCSLRTQFQFALFILVTTITGMLIQSMVKLWTTLKIKKSDTRNPLTSYSPWSSRTHNS